MDFVINILKLICINIGTYIIALKITNIKPKNKIEKLIVLIGIVIVSIIISIIKEKTSFLNSTLVQIIGLTIIISKNIKKGFSNVLIVTIISLSINYMLFFISIAVVYIISNILKINNEIIILILLISVDLLCIYMFKKNKKLKYGFSFLQSNMNDEYGTILILNIGVILLFVIVIISNSKGTELENIVFGFLIFSIIMFITIQKSLQLYYKQKLLVQELEQTKKDLADKTKEIEILEKENITISKRNHTIDHKQKSLELKMAEMMNKSEISQEEAAEVSERLKQIRKDISGEKIATELDKTEISEIDDMLKYMQIECNKNKIEFELQIKGNIHYMTNNLISKEDLETLLADHIKNAIIAVEHTNNINRSVLVRLGKIDENYGLYI